ncbi:hypothetical protein AB0I16_35505, partial [Streptomyces sp. NPDC050703]
LALAPVAVVPMVVYPYGKRFTNFPQAILGPDRLSGRSSGHRKANSPEPYAAPSTRPSPARLALLRRNNRRTAPPEAGPLRLIAGQHALDGYYAVIALRLPH